MYTFSSDTWHYSLAELKYIEWCANKLFKTQEDLSQLQINDKNSEFIYKKFNKSQNIVKYKDEVIWEVLVLPCKKTYMKLFLADKISESQLFEKITKNVDYTNYNCLYICLAYIKTEHQKKWLATKATIKTIQKIIDDKKNIELFARWYSKTWAKICKKVAEKLNLPIYIKKDMIS